MAMSSHPSRMAIIRTLVFLLMLKIRYTNCADENEMSDSAKYQPKSSVVTTKYGSLRGVIEVLSNKHLQPVEMFLGVPYAGVPLGSLRFLPPGTPPQWKGIRTADHLGPVCPQRVPDISNETEALKRMPAGRYEYLKRLLPFLVNQSEDCLYLNIYAPAGSPRNAKSRIPVMVFIHGESYDWNSGNSYDGSVIASLGNIIVITINFRLGIFGFLPAVEGSSRGNYGIMDQVAALHWIQENIAEFGGDPKNVTVFGHGHGAACVNLLMLTPLTKGLFQRAIMQSGSALSPWAIARNSLAYTRQIAKSLKCPIEDSAVLVECLRQRPVQDILDVPLSVPDHLSAFGPTIDGVVVPGEPAEVMEKHTDFFGQYDLMFGMTRIESYDQFSSQEDKSGIDVLRRDRLLRTLVRNLFTYHLQEIFLTVVNEYTDGVPPLVRTGNFHSRVRHPRDPKTFQYVFTHQTEDAGYSQRMGTVHGEDLPYVFGAPLVNSLSHFSRNFTKSESSLSETVIMLWTNFAKYGDPNEPHTDNENVSNEKIKGKFERLWWPEYNDTHQKFISIGLKPRLRDHYHAHRLSFWLNLIPTLHRAAAFESTTTHHLLEDHDNPNTYDGIVRSNIAGESIVITTPSTTTSSSATTAKDGGVNTNAYATLIILEERPTIAPKSMNISGSLAMIFQQGAYSTALTVTIGIGCSLLILNIVIFAGVYLNRERTVQHHVDYKERS
ncbi:Neuroligin-4 like protein [Argiope bruennichi]|uniref:Neuroligin-4 like protein n=1 Tax=Argiope bruennichi TaxID=94029 RepID=A0A8T0E693_ARGBR|nr:Neuroligin-4 like protein [Argiope bruennichi]